MQGGRYRVLIEVVRLAASVAVSLSSFARVKVFVRGGCSQVCLAQSRTLQKLLLCGSVGGRIGSLI